MRSAQEFSKLSDRGIPEFDHFVHQCDPIDIAELCLSRLAIQKRLVQGWNLPLRDIDGHDDPEGVVRFVGARVKLPLRPLPEVRRPTNHPLLTLGSHVAAP